MVKGGRDREYIEGRLLSPCVAASEAHGRLVQCREHELAARLMTAMQNFHDECRAIRHEVIFGEKQNAV